MPPTQPKPFRVVIAVHRPRFRGRAVRAAELTGWEVTTLLNRQDPVGQVAKSPGPPDILLISHDFGRQKTLAIFRAVQPWRAKGMKIVGMMDDCNTPPEGFPDLKPSDLCDVCLEPPFKMAEIRQVLTDLFEEIRQCPAPLPVKKVAVSEDEDLEGDN